MAVLLNALVLQKGMVDDADWYRWLILTLPLLVTAVWYQRTRPFPKGNTHPGKNKALQDYRPKNRDRCAEECWGGVLERDGQGIETSWPSSYPTSME